MSAVLTGWSKQRGFEVCGEHPFPYYGKLSRVVCSVVNRDKNQDNFNFIKIGQSIKLGQGM